MTDAQQIDPERPWIDDPRDAPSAMEWLPTFTNPMGETPRLHFTRGWTLLFFARLFLYLIPIVLVAILGAAGARSPESMVPPAWLFPLFVLVTAIASAIMHLRRLNNARRSPIWASLVLLPVLFGGAGFVAGSFQGSAAYERAVAERDGKVIAIEDLIADGEAEADGADDGDDDGGDGNRRGGRGQGESLDVTEVSARKHAFDTAISTSIMFWALPSFFVMLWSLLWVGRLPNGGGTIRDRVAQMRADGVTEQF